MLILDIGVTAPMLHLSTRTSQFRKKKALDICICPMHMRKCLFTIIKYSRIMAHPGLIPLNNLRVTKVLCMYSTEVQTFFRIMTNQTLNIGYYLTCLI
jgi:hypothetical protein